MVETNATVSREQLYRAAIDPDQDEILIHGEAAEIVIEIEDGVEDLADDILEETDSELNKLDNKFSELVLDMHIDKLSDLSQEELVGLYD